jgi:serine O-acetyltransferase
MLQPVNRTAMTSTEEIWSRLRREAAAMQSAEPALARYAAATITGATRFGEAVGNLLAEKLAGPELSADQLRELFALSHRASLHLEIAAGRDLAAIVTRDPAAGELLVPFLFFKGFHALQAHRLAHWLWNEKRRHLALYLQNRVSDLFAVDIHPAARIGAGIMMDHATGIVMGETVVVEDNVSIMHAVTLGGTGKETGDRHPKIRSGVMIGAGAKILGNIEVGERARVAAGSVVLQDVPACRTVAGVPAKVVGDAGCDEPAQEMNQMLPGDCISM